MKFAPIVIFSYNRPNHLKKVIDALAENDYANESILYIYCDGAKPDSSKEDCDRISQNREIAHLASGFKELHVIERETNIGLAENIVGAVSDIVEKYGRVITLEDDVITSKGYLRYMNEALELYQNDEAVMHITGFMWHHKGKLPETFFYPVPECGGGWATWQRAWKYFTKDSKRLYDYWKNDWSRFNIIGGNILQKQLEANYYGTLHTWFIKWHAVVMQRNGLTLYPGRSLTTNIGFDGSGTNCMAQKNPFFWAQLADTIKVERIQIKESKRARYQIYCAHQGRFFNKRNRFHIFRYFKDLISHMNYGCI